MPAISASAPGKVILFGEHAVVYGQPAIAVPVQDVAAQAIVTPDIAAPSGRIHIQAPQVDLDVDLDSLPEADALAAAVRASLAAVGVSHSPAFKIRITSTIPVAGGLGSGAAVSVAILRAVSGFLGHPLENPRVSELAFEIEKLHHGTPSGIDNTVITFAQPVFFIKDQLIERLNVARQFTLLIADTGVPALTRETVGAVRNAWKADPRRYEGLFSQIGELATQARQTIEAGNNDALGPLMSQNHALLQQLDVSSPELDRLVSAAAAAGALGAKLSGGGWGGNMLALVDSTTGSTVRAALESAGAVNVLETTVRATA